METPSDLLHQALGLPTEHSPFPWQQRLLKDFVRGELPRALDLPTGLGKTSVLAIWLVARALGADLPRRLVYVVDRRAVVDQSTEVALQLRKWVAEHTRMPEALGLRHGKSLPISTLRGQFVDNREWLDDPASSAIIVGTVDMVGSRLLFEGYGVSRKMRPYQAGLLGADTLFVLDESHLVPAFERLIEQVCRRSEIETNIAPRVQLLSLSATGRHHVDTFGLEDEDFAHPVVAQRYRAVKRVTLRSAVEDKLVPNRLAEEAWALAEASEVAVRVLVFCSGRDHAQKAKKIVDKRGRKAGPRGRGTPETELFVGARRVHERQAAAERLGKLGFLAGIKEFDDKDAFLFATSAGEVGVDLDADHMVSDVVAWERMVQRLGRVNRRGEKEASVVVIPRKERKPDGPDIDAVERLLADLPKDGNGTPSASPASLDQLRRIEDNIPRIAAATTPEPLYPPLSGPLLESWAMTSLHEHTGRPEVTPWLRGWIKQEPQTQILWRSILPPDRKTLEALLNAASPHVAETVTAITRQAADWLFQLCKRLGPEGIRGTRLVLLDARGEFFEILSGAILDSKKGLEDRLADKTLIVSATAGGLSYNERGFDGLLDPAERRAVPTADQTDGWGQADPDQVPEVPWQIETISLGAAETTRPGWSTRIEIPVAYQEKTLTPIVDEPTNLLRVLRWKGDAATEDDRSISKALQTLSEHQEWAAQQARSLTARLNTDAAHARLIELAARLHDEGKRAMRWQQAFSAPAGEQPYAKTRGPVRTKILSGYRHEFGSLAYLDGNPELDALSPEDRDLVLHLIASHHGRARPNIEWKGSVFEPPSRARERAQDVALRYVRVQRRYGPWGLAYLEALLRSADQQASRRLEETER